MERVCYLSRCAPYFLIAIFSSSPNHSKGQAAPLLSHSRIFCANSAWLRGGFALPSPGSQPPKKNFVFGDVVDQLLQLRVNQDEAVSVFSKHTSGEAGFQIW
jgi:hypothetical protein